MRRFLRATLLLMIPAAVPMAAQLIGRDYGRSTVMAQQGIVATSQTLASQAGAQILAAGGSAVDAAIAANAVLSVLEPMMDGPGGDFFALYWDAKTGQITGLNSSGPAPRGLTPQFLAAKGISSMPASGIHSVTVPGTVRGWAAIHQRYGKLPWKDLFQPAIAYADKGFPVAEAIHEEWFTARLESNEESRRLFLRSGHAPAVGEVFRNPDLAHAFRLIAAQGANSVYSGDVARAILATSQALGGTMSAEDLASFKPEWVQPISIDYRGWKVYELPPNGQGMAALEMLNIMETTPADPEGPFTAAELHKRIEAMKLAYSDLHRYNADPRSHDVPVAALLSKDYARRRAALIDSNHANCGVIAGDPIGSDTTYLTVVDRQGNIVSWIQSIYSQFGSGVAVKGMGFELHNRGAGFTLDPTSPNVLAGGKRPFHTIIPAFMERGDLHIGFGIMGGANQPLAHAQFVSNLVDYGMNVQQALESPRFTKATAAGCELSMESRVPAAVIEQLRQRGHKPAVRRPYTQEMGRGQAIAHNSKTGVNYAASDPRADGSAAPEPVP